MKTQWYGRSNAPGLHHYFIAWASCSCLRPPFRRPLRSSRAFTPHCLGENVRALKDYIEHRDNGGESDKPKDVFPDGELSKLDIQSSDWQGSNFWPDEQCRYWWKLTCKDGRKINDFYWMEDRRRGYPDSNGYYWFSVHHARSETRMEGFSARPDKAQGYPDKDGYYWSYIQYDECGSIKAWMEQKDENYAARLQREKASEQSKVAAQRAAKEDSEKRAEEMKRLEETRIAAEKAQALATAEKEALTQERLRIEQERCQWEAQKYKHEEAQAKKASNKALSPSLNLTIRSLPPIPLSKPFSRPSPSRDSSFSIRYEDIRLIQELGAGAFGAVSYGKWHFEDVAVKTLHLQKLSENALLEFKEEAAIMARLHSDYIVVLKGVSLTPYALVMEYMRGGSLFNVLHSQTELSWPLRHRIALDVAKGLAFLHQHPPHGILHRDLKSQNVLLTEYLRAKLADFGLSQVRVESSRSQAYAQSSNKSVGTIAWMAPECFGLRPKYSEKSDMYAYGMVLWELISRKTPYEEVNNTDEIRAAVKDGEREEIPTQTTNPSEAIPVSFKEVIRFCWFQEAGKRPTAKEAIETLGDISIPLPATSSSSSSSGSSSGLPSGFISHFSSFKP